MNDILDSKKIVQCPVQAYHKHVKVKGIFCDKLISKNLWPPKSPDLSTPDFSILEYLKKKVYVNNPQTVNDLKIILTQTI